MPAEIFDLVPMDQAPNRIRAIRLRAGLSQQALADRIGTSKVTISSLEVGRMQLTFDYMKRLAREFGLTPVDLLLEDEQNSLLREDEMALIRAYRAAGEIQRDLIHRVAEHRATLDFSPPPEFTGPDTTGPDGADPDPDNPHSRPHSRVA